MKKTFFLSISLVVICIFFGCKTLPIEKQNINITQSLSDSTYLLKESNAEIKIYFPSFTVWDESLERNRMIQGDGMVIILPDEKCMMVDSFVTEGQKQLVDFLTDLGITKIDYFFATHNHGDHIGGVPTLVKNFTIDHYYWNGVHFNSSCDKTVTEALESKQIETSVLKQGDSLVLCEEPLCKIDVFWPNLSEEDIYNAYYNPGRTERLKNNTSLVFKLTYGEFTVLFTGDIYKQADKVLTETYGSELKSTVLKVPHHGEFYTANGPDFVKAVSPDVAILQDNQYMLLPISNLVISKIYRDINATLLYRNTAGYILVTSNGTEYSVKEESFTE